MDLHHFLCVHFAPVVQHTHKSRLRLYLFFFFFFVSALCVCLIFNSPHRRSGFFLLFFGVITSRENVILSTTGSLSLTHTGFPSDVFFSIENRVYITAHIYQSPTLSRCQSWCTSLSLWFLPFYMSFMRGNALRLRRGKQHNHTHTDTKKKMYIYISYISRQTERIDDIGHAGRSEFDGSRAGRIIVVGRTIFILSTCISIYIFMYRRLYVSIMRLIYKRDGALLWCRARVDVQPR